MAKQFTVMLDNKRGALAVICSILAEKAFNILGLKYSKEEVVADHLPDRPGALSKLTRKVAGHNVDVKYAYGSISRGPRRALIVLAFSDPDAAARVVK